MRSRWLVFAGAFVLIGVGAAINVFSVLTRPLAALRGWELADISLGYSIFTLCVAVMGIVAGKIVDVGPPRPVLAIGSACFGVGWYLAGIVTTIPLLYLSLALAGCGCGLTYNPTIATTLRWFPDIRGKVSGALLASAAIGPATISPIANGLIESLGVARALNVLGLAYGVSMIVVVALMRRPPANWAPTAAAARQSASPRPLIKESTWREMVRTPSFWLMFAVMAIGATAGTMMINSLSNMAQFQVGVSAAFAAALVSVSTLSNLVGRLVSGAGFDRFGPLWTLVGILTLMIVAMGGFALARSAGFFIAVVVVLGFAFGGVMVVFPPMTSAVFGVVNSGINYGVMFLAYAVGGFIGPRLATALFDPNGAGYLRAYLAAGALAIVGVALTLVLIRRDPIRRATEAYHRELTATM